MTIKLYFIDHNSTIDYIIPSNLTKNIEHLSSHDPDTGALLEEFLTYPDHRSNVGSIAYGVFNEFIYVVGADTAATQFGPNQSIWRLNTTTGEASDFIHNADLHLNAPNGYRSFHAGISVDNQGRIYGLYNTQAANVCKGVLRRFAADGLSFEDFEFLRYVPSEAQNTINNFPIINFDSAQFAISPDGQYLYGIENWNDDVHYYVNGGLVQDNRTHWDVIRWSIPSMGSESIYSHRQGSFRACAGPGVPAVNETPELGNIDTLSVDDIGRVWITIERGPALVANSDCTSTIISPATILLQAVGDVGGSSFDLGQVVSTDGLHHLTQLVPDGLGNVYTFFTTQTGPDSQDGTVFTWHLCKIDSNGRFSILPGYSASKTIMSGTSMILTFEPFIAIPTKELFPGLSRFDPVSGDQDYWLEI